MNFTELGQKKPSFCISAVACIENRGTAGMLEVGAYFKTFKVLISTTLMIGVMRSLGEDYFGSIQSVLRTVG